MRVLWVTNLAAPYRVPLWQALAQSVELTVCLLESPDSLHRDGRNLRGQDWVTRAVPGVRTVTPRCARLTLHEDARLYTLLDPRLIAELHRADVVLLGGWESPAYWQVLTAAKLLGRATVGFYEGIPASHRWRAGPVAAARRAFFAGLDGLVVPGPAAAEAATAIRGHSRGLAVGFNAVDVEAFHEIALTAGGRSSSGHRYAFVGRLISLKRVPDVIAAFAAIATPDDELFVVGQGPDEAACRAAAERWGVVEAVHFVGPLPASSMPALMASVDTLVLASNREVWGLVVNEALAAGRHVVVAENCGAYGSVAGMRGVYAVRAGLDNLEDQLRASRHDWSGPIEDPEILAFTPGRFAETFASAFAVALGRDETSPAPAPQERV